MGNCFKLREGEKESFRKFKDEDKDAYERALEALRMIFDFWGIQWDPKTGSCQRTGNYEERYKNRNAKRHNNLRITRVISFLDVIGLGRFQAPLVKYLLKESFDPKCPQGADHPKSSLGADPT